MAFSTTGAAGGAGTGASIGTAFAPGIGTAIGAGIGFIAGGIIGGIGESKQEDAERKARRDAERTRINSVLREFGAQQQAAATAVSGAKRAEGSKSSKTDSVIPDPIADTSGFIGGGVPNTPANGSRTSGDF